MRKLLLAVGLLAGVGLQPVITVAADSLTSSNNPSVAGETVTFTASFAVGCADGASTTWTVDGTPVAGGGAQMNGTQATATYSTSTLTVGLHEVAFSWNAGVAPNPTCSGGASLAQEVDAPPQPTSAPRPAPTAEPSPAPTPTPTPSPSPAASAARINLTASAGSGFPLGLAALIVVTVAVAGLAAFVYRPRAKS